MSTRTHIWVPVRYKAYCALGAHEVVKGAWLRYRIGDYYRSASCDQCLAKSGITRPSAVVEDQGESGGDAA